jgi:hypothetical protein
MKAHKVDEFTILGRNFYGRRLRCPKCGHWDVHFHPNNDYFFVCKKRKKYKYYNGCGYLGPIHEFRGEVKRNGKWFKL